MPLLELCFPRPRKLEVVRSDSFGRHLPMGTGPIWDLVVTERSIALIESFYDVGSGSRAVRHAPSVFRRVT
jgi:hypothetical protein